MEDNLHAGDLELVAVRPAKGERRLAVREDVAQVATARADEVVMGEVGVRVVATRPGGSWDLEHLAHRDEFVQGVVDRGKADLGQAFLGATVHGLGGEVDVLTVEHLGDDAPLGREPPVARP